MKPAYWVQTDTRWGPLWINPFDIWVGGSFLVYGEFSPDEWKFLQGLVKPGDTVLDIGANIGGLTFPLAAAVGPTGHVIACEPQPDVVDLLHANLLMRTSKTPITVLNKAVGATPGTINVPTQHYDQLGNFGGVEFGGRGGTEVDMITVDSLQLETLALLKADVEGMEPDVLQGARATIARCRPLLYVECDREHRRAELLALVDALGYRIKYHYPPLFNPDNYRHVKHPLHHLVHTGVNPPELLPVIRTMIQNNPPKLAEQLIEVIGAAPKSSLIVSINLIGIPNELPEQAWER